MADEDLERLRGAGHRITRRTFAEVEALARRRERDDTIAQVCRVLKHHMGLPHVGDELYRLMDSGEPLIETQKPFRIFDAERS